jgi:hypothetical protein
VTAPAPEFIVIPPEPIARFDVLLLVPELERMKTVDPVDLNVCESAVRLAAPSETLRLPALLASILKMVSSVVDGTTPPVTVDGDVDQLPAVPMLAPLVPAQ